MKNGFWKTAESQTLSKAYPGKENGDKYSKKRQSRKPLESGIDRKFPVIYCCWSTKFTKGKVVGSGGGGHRSWVVEALSSSHTKKVGLDPTADDKPGRDF